MLKRFAIYRAGGDGLPRAVVGVRQVCHADDGKGSNDVLKLDSRRNVSRAPPADSPAGPPFSPLPQIYSPYIYELAKRFIAASRLNCVVQHTLSAGQRRLDPVWRLPFLSPQGSAFLQVALGN